MKFIFLFFCSLQKGKSRWAQIILHIFLSLLGCSLFWVQSTIDDLWLCFCQSFGYILAEKIIIGWPNGSVLLLVFSDKADQSRWKKLQYKGKALLFQSAFGAGLNTSAANSNIIRA
jgi:hypothetical protein